MQNTMNPLVVRVSWPTLPSEMLVIRFHRAVGFGRELQFLIDDPHGKPVSAIAASSMALGIRDENPTTEIAESALAQNALFAALPQFLANQVGRTDELYNLLQETFIQLTSENLELLPRSAWVN